MTIFPKWTFRRIPALVLEVLSQRSGWIGVWNSPVIARELSSGGRPVVAMSPQGNRGALRASLTALPLMSGTLSALVGVGAGAASEWEACLAEWTRVVASTGMVVMIDDGPREELTRRALLAGLVELEQRSSAGVVVTSGRVWR